MVGSLGPCNDPRGTDGGVGPGEQVKDFALVGRRLEGNAWREAGCLAFVFRAFAICLISLAEL